MKNYIITFFLIFNALLAFSQYSNEIESRNDEVVESLKYIDIENHLSLLKSSKELVEMQKLDSSYYFIYDTILDDSVLLTKYYYLYDTTGRPTFFMTIRRDNVEVDFDTLSKTEYTYSNNPNSFQYIDYLYNSNEHVFNPSLKIIIYYDEQGRYIAWHRLGWDNVSSVWRNLVIFECEYDLTGNEIYNETLAYSMDEEIFYGQRLFKQFDLNNNEKECLELRFNVTEQVWDSLRNTLYEYNDYNLITNQSVFNYDESSQIWNLNHKFEKNYYGQLLADSTIFYANDLVLVPYSKSIYTYILGKQESCINYFWENNLEIWQISYKKEYQYNTNGLMESIFCFNGNAATNEWEFYEKYEYEYDILGNIIISSYFMWDDNTESWEKVSKNEYTYDEEMRVLTNLTYYKDSETNDWRIVYKYEFGYDQLGNQLFNHKSDWNTETTEWICSEFVDYTYNTEFDLDELILPMNFVVHTSCFSMLTNKEHYGNIPEHTIQEYYYSSVMIENSSTQIYTHDIVVFPNPATTNISVVLTENSQNVNFYLFDMQGRCLIEKLVQSDSQIDISNLSNGLYFYKVVDGFDIFSGKLIKQ
jgi:hypothetical protein